MPSKPMLESDIWEKCVSLSDELKEAVMNPNTDFMTKLLFDARFFSKKTGKEIAYYSNLIVKIKLLLHEKKQLSEKDIAKLAKITEGEAKELLSYLKNMSEILLDGEGKYSLNYSNPFSKPFKG